MYLKGFILTCNLGIEGRNGIIIVDLGSGESWRHLDLFQDVRSQKQFLPFIWGQPVFYALGGLPYSYFPLGSDGIALAADGERLYWGPLGSRYLYSIATSLLRDRSQTSELLAQQGVTSHGEKGASDGFETDSSESYLHPVTYNILKNFVSL